MNVDTISITLSIGSLLGMLWAVFSASRRLGELELKVDTMWAFQMRRAMSETVSTGLGSMNSPLIFSDFARHSLDPIEAELKELWRQTLQFMDDAEALLEIERVYGDRLLTLVCVPCGLSHGACLLLAFSVASDKREIELKL